MGTFIFICLLDDRFYFGSDTGLTMFGRILRRISIVLSIVIVVILMIPFAVLENVFILPAWGIYNLVHTKGNRKTYTQFIHYNE